MNKTELQGIITKWWVWNAEQSQVGEGYQFISQIGDWQSGFRNWTKDEYQADTAFTVAKCKDIKEGLSIRLQSGNVYTDGILVMKTGEWIEKPADGVGSWIAPSARIDG